MKLKKKMVEINKLAWEIGGEAGYGIIATGSMFAKLCIRSGLYAFLSHDYPSLIRGGHNICYVRAEEDIVTSHIDVCDLLVALNKETIDLHKNELTNNGGIIFDNEEVAIDDKQIRNDIRLYRVPLMKIAREAGGEKLLRNSIALGASVAILNMDYNLLVEILKENYAKKGEKVVVSNIEAAKRGYEYINKNYNSDFRNKIVKKERKEIIFMTGNEAISVAAIKAGLKFYCQYPMTPTSQILHYLVSKADEYGITVLQLEDEISVINTAYGASWAGARSMIATAGGGFALMTEAFGLGSMAELPLVIVVGQRAGPTTGLPTKTEQSDLGFITHAAPSDFLRLVVAPGDVEECFYLTLDAFNLADKLQNPAVILIDQYLANNGKTVDKFDVKNYKVDRGLLANDKDLFVGFKRYKYDNNTGVTARSLPGQKNGLYNCAADEHDEFGQICEDVSNRVNIMKKRMKKIDYAKELTKDKAVNLFGDENAWVTIVGWGSTKGRILEALKYLRNEGLNINFLQVVYLSPFPSERVIYVLNKSKSVVVIEENYSGQLCKLIAENTGIKIENIFTKFSGVPFSPLEIYNKVKEFYYKKRG